MITRRELLAVIVIVGAISASSAIAPRSCPCAGGFCGISLVATAGDNPGASARLVWKTPGRDRSKSWVELQGIDSGRLELLKAPGMTPRRFESFFWVHVVRDDQPGSDPDPPVLGSYQVAGEVVRFQPRFGLEPGVHFRAEFDPEALDKLIDELAPSGEHGRSEIGNLPALSRLARDWSYAREPAQPTARVAEVYPTAATLPDNLLRFYIHFSAPMSRGESYRHVRLIAADTEKPIDAPFLELGEELWSSDGTRFTLVFSPGRIKRGLKPREELGPILEAGKSYVLVIDRDWTDAGGTPLVSEFRRAFRAGPPDQISPDPKTWRIEPPRAGTNDPLSVRFGEPLDRALIGRLITLKDAAGKRVPGRTSIGAGETAWSLTPAAQWKAGEYRLVVGTELEDLAGNSVASPFEVDLAGPITEQLKSETVVLPFRVGP